jgi:hypothetical protein
MYAQLGISAAIKEAGDILLKQNKKEERSSIKRKGRT